MLQSDATSLRGLLGSVSSSPARILSDAGASVALSELARGTSLGSGLSYLAGRSVLVATADQLTTALALIELDGVARRLVLCPCGLPAEHLAYVIAQAGVDAIVSDHNDPIPGGGSVPLRVNCGASIAPLEVVPPQGHATEWVMLTSGTTGMPKMVVHSLASLTAPIRAARKPPDGTVVWSTFYDIRRYGGLQIFFRGILCGGSLVLSSAQEPVGSYLARAGACGVTHISGTPSHWRSALMSPSARAISPRYVRMSGEIADQAILDQLRAFYPQAGVAHAYASTEAGVGFEVDDGREGFPAHLIGRTGADVEMKIEDSSLRVRSSRTASRYLVGDGPALKDADGFIDTGDIVELRGERYHFVGRRGGIINVGGLKVHPEEVEAVINRHPEVRASLVRSRKNPITGAIVVADVVLRVKADAGTADRTTADHATEVKREILQVCRDALAEYKVPAAIRIVPALDVATTGKLARQHA